MAGMLDVHQSLIKSTLRKVLKRLHYPLEVMLVCVRWYAAYPLSLNVFCCNKGVETKSSPNGVGESISQSIELICCRRSFAIRAAQLPLLNHVHGLYASNDDSCTPK